MDSTQRNLPPHPHLQLLKQHVKRFHQHICISCDADLHWIIQEIIFETNTPHQLRSMVESALLSTSEIEMCIQFREKPDGSFDVHIPVFNLKALVQVRHLELAFDIDPTNEDALLEQYEQIVLAYAGGMAALKGWFPDLDTLIVHLRVDDSGVASSDLVHGTGIRVDYGGIKMLKVMKGVAGEAYHEGPGREKIFSLSVGTMRCYDVEIGALLNALEME